MYQRILVPLDGSELAEAVLPYATALADCTGAEIALLRVVVEPVYEYAFTDPLIGEKIREQIKTEAADYLERVAQNLQQDGFRVMTQVADGLVPEVILDGAERLHTDLIAMSTHGRTGLARFLIGSVADRVIHACKTPVLIVRPFPAIDSRSHRQGPAAQANKSARIFHQILVPLDGSELAEQALPHAEALARRTGARVILLHVPVYSNEPVVMIPGLPPYDLLPMPSPGTETLAKAKRYLEQMKREVALRGLMVSTVTREGPPAETIIQFAHEQNMDLIVMSTHGRTGLSRMVFGSVAEEVLRGSGKPVLLIRPEA